MNNQHAAGVPARKTQLVEKEETNYTFLTEENIIILKRMFKTKDEYIKHISCLWVARALLYEQLNDDVRHPLFPLFDTINNVIGSLLQWEFDFCNVRNGYVMHNGKKIDLQDILHYEFKPFGRK